MARKSSTDAAGVTTFTDSFEDTAPKQYVILHGGVGPWWQGQIITDEHLQGHDAKRLLGLGAIAEAGSEAAYQASRDGLAGVTPLGDPVSEPVPPPPVVEPSVTGQTQDAPTLTGGNATGF